MRPDIDTNLLESRTKFRDFLFYGWLPERLNGPAWKADVPKGAQRFESFIIRQIDSLFFKEMKTIFTKSLTGELAERLKALPC